MHDDTFSFLCLCSLLPALPACAPCVRSRASCWLLLLLCVFVCWPPGGGCALCVRLRRAFASSCCACVCVRLRLRSRLRHCACVQYVSRRLVVVVRRCVVLGLLCRFGGLLWCGLCVALCWGCVVLGLWLGVLQIAVCVFLCCVLCTVYYYYYYYYYLLLV